MLVYRILNVILAIALGCGGVIGLFYLANYAINALPKPWNQRILPWVYVAPALLVLSAYLILPTLQTIYLSFFDGRSQNFIGLNNYAFAFTDSSMLVAFRNTFFG